ncbi:hypothetical protein CWI37_0239p0030 [Hamiltosporidium tvaerminnensis]|uniref:Uncharacterized protein n=1 Tax=Hamiltosporidium tvaerminnensis TaxID=1176355 RepID=A0A4Q9L942_9MICR|nr:hypothetical protein CWI37_0239p0030 [Hamiltosporidium tvaerminnensis]
MNSDFYLVRKVQEATKCTKEVAEKALLESKNDAEKAITAIKKKKGNDLYVGGYRSGLMVEGGDKKKIKTITVYKNGILVEDVFYDYKKKENRDLKKMLDNREFDRNILGEDGETAEVVFNDRENEEYKVKVEHFTGTSHTLSGKKEKEIECPDSIIVDEDGDVFFKVLLSGRRIKIQISSKKTVNDFIIYMKKYTEKEYELYDSETLVERKSEISSVKNSLVTMKLKK